MVCAEIGVWDTAIHHHLAVSKRISSIQDKANRTALSREQWLEAERADVLWLRAGCPQR